MSRWKDIWPEYTEQLQKRLEKGYTEYSDDSFALTPEDLIRELQEEVLDISAWGLILYSRFKAMYGVVDDLRMEAAALEQARDKLRESEPKRS